MSSQQLGAECSVVLGGVTFQLEPMPWKEQRRLCVSIYEVGAAVASGEFTEAVLDSMTQVLAVGLRVDADRLDSLNTNMFEISQAFQMLMRVTGLEQQMEHALGEMLSRGPRAPQPAPSISASETVGTTSTQEPPPSPVGPGPSSTK